LAGRDLISQRTRRAFREHLVFSSTLQEIAGMFEDEGIARSSDMPAVSGEHRTPQRSTSLSTWLDRTAERTLVERYYATVNWTSARDVGRVLQVYETILHRVGRDVAVHEELVNHLRRDGYFVLQGSSIQGLEDKALAPELPTEALTDATSIYEHLDRMSRSMDDDPALAISAARALIEATTKLVLKELGAAYNEKDKIPALVKAAQQALGLHPDTLAPTAKGAESVKRILSSLSQVAIGVAELRNEYGPDHGRTQTTAGLGARHAHLAVGCAGAYCRLLLETLADPAAPWRQMVKGD
jgi:hypothetical protein